MRGTADSYRVFVRNWWKLNPGWPGGLEPDGCARKTTLARHCTEEEARARCAEYARTHEPGRLSRKAEYEAGQGAEWQDERLGARGNLRPLTLAGRGWRLPSGASVRAYGGRGGEMAEAVFVVTGEFQGSENGEVCWVVGVARSEQGAQALARADAETDHADRCCILPDGERVGPWDGVHTDDWEVYYEANATPVSA